MVARELRECLSEVALDLFHVATVLRLERDIELAFMRPESIVTRLGATDSLGDAPYVWVLQ